MKNKESANPNVIAWRVFSSLGLTIFLFILLAVTSVFGTIILQNAAPEQYLAEYGIALTRILDFFGLSDMYHSWWFRSILILLVINLFFCSLNRLPGVWRQIFHPRISLSPSTIQGLPFTKILQATAEEGLEERIHKAVHHFFRKPLRIENPDSLLLYFEKGKYGRLGIYIAHLSVILILAGAVIGSIYGFKGYLKIGEGESVARVPLRRGGQSVARPLGFEVRCDDFEISYYNMPGPEKPVSEYTTTVSILENGQQVGRKKIRVNHPMVYKGLNFYQSSYGAERVASVEARQREGGNPYEFQVREGERVRIPGSDVSVQFLGIVPEGHKSGEGAVMALFRKGQSLEQFLLSKGTPDSEKRGGVEFVFTLKDISSREFTVLQVVRDPGQWVVWIGCTLLIVGTCMAFFISHRKLWVHIPRGKGNSGRISLGGTSHRNQFGFAREFEMTVQRLREAGLKVV